MKYEEKVVLRRVTSIVWTIFVIITIMIISEADAIQKAIFVGFNTLFSIAISVFDISLKEEICFDIILTVMWVIPTVVNIVGIII